VFTGLVEATGRIAFIRRVGEGLDLAVEAPGLIDGLAIGDSIALSGCCTTVTRIDGRRVEFHMTKETLERTTFGRAAAGRLLNLERALRADSRLGGHFVQGHVDGVGEVTHLLKRRDGWDLTIQVPDELSRYCVEKGSISIDGISLTVARLTNDSVMIALIPHTWESTTLKDAKVGDRVHIEVDVLAKYVERLLPFSK